MVARKKFSKSDTWPGFNPRLLALEDSILPQYYEVYAYMMMKPFNSDDPPGLKCSKTTSGPIGLNNFQIK